MSCVALYPAYRKMLYLHSEHNGYRVIESAFLAGF
jgi:hypothetical protein